MHSVRYLSISFMKKHLFIKLHLSSQIVYMLVRSIAWLCVCVMYLKLSPSFSLSIGFFVGSPNVRREYLMHVDIMRFVINIFVIWLVFLFGFYSNTFEKYTQFHLASILLNFSVRPILFGV